MRRAKLAICGMALLAGFEQSALAQSASVSFADPNRFLQRDGEAIYRAICQGCHMPGGQGAIGAGAYPALAANPQP